MACNTSYSAAIYNIIKQELKELGSRVELLHMPMETCLHLKNDFPESRRIGLMTSNGTYKTGLYKKILQDMNYEVIIPDADFQDGIIHRIIYDPDWGIKACQNKISERALTMFHQAIDFFKDNQTDAIILGCTEFSLITNAELIKGMSIIDATDCLAKAMVKRALTQRLVAKGL
ncbi:Aspartate racemase [compost metagenome]